MNDQERVKALIERNEELQESLNEKQETQGFASSSVPSIVIQNSAPVPKAEEKKTPKWQQLQQEFDARTGLDLDLETWARYSKAVASKDEEALEMLILELKRSPMPESFVATEFTAGIHFRRLNFYHLIFTLFAVFMYQAFTATSTVYLLTPSQCRPYLPVSEPFGFNLSYTVFWVPSPDAEQTHFSKLLSSVVDKAASLQDETIGYIWGYARSTYLAYLVDDLICRVTDYASILRFLNWYWFDPDAVLKITCQPVIENRVKWVMAWAACSVLLSVYRFYCVTHVKLHKIMIKHHFDLEKLDPVDLVAWQVNNRHPSLRFGRTLEASEPRRIRHKIHFFVTRTRSFGYFVSISTFIVDALTSFWLSIEGQGRGFQEADDFWVHVPATAVRGLKNTYHRHTTETGIPSEVRESFGSAVGPNLDGRVIDFTKFNSFSRQASVIGCDGFEKMAKNAELAVKTANAYAENWRASEPNSAMVLMSLIAYQWLAVVHEANPRIRDDIKWSF